MSRFNSQSGRASRIDEMDMRSTAKKLPLSGRRIVITRAQEQADKFSALLEAVGAEPIILPLIRIADPPSWTSVDDALRNLNQFHGIIFTSTNAVRQWVKRSREIEAPPAVDEVKILAVGSATAECLIQNRMQVDSVPKRFSADGLLASLPDDLRGQRYLLPRGDRAREELSQGLKARAAEVVDVVVYSTQSAAPDSSKWIPRFLRGDFDFVTFASPSAVHSFAEWVGPSRWEDVLRHIHAASIGPTTSAALRAHGVEVAAEADASTLERLTSAIVRFYHPS